MTAEVAIANGSAVALAADSAVTIGGRKIYNSAIKLFSLSKVQPVGIMIYGNANLLDVPWETIIKTCRKDLADNKFDRLEEYGEHLISYIKKNNWFFTKDSQERWIERNTRGYFEGIREEAFEKFEIAFNSNKDIAEQEILKIFTSIVLKNHKSLQSLDFTADFDLQVENELKTNYTKLIKVVTQSVFQNLKISRGIFNKLIDISIFLHTREIFSDGVSGVVIAGFGESEIYPSILTYEIEGVLEDKLKFRKIDGKSHKISHGNDCTIIAFAQEDMVASFMSGMNPSILQLIDVYLKQIFDRFPEILTDEMLAGSAIKAEKIRALLQQNGNYLRNDFIKSLRKHSNDQHITPVLNMATVLPKDELAAMAESLVNLTAFKRKMTNSLETVGGPIDVIVISKGDGLVWVKRKLYFPKELNHNFFLNYHRGIEND